MQRIHRRQAIFSEGGTDLLRRIAAFTMALVATGLVCIAGAGEPAAPAPETIHLIDARYLRQRDLGKPEQAAEIWDTMHALSALQGIVNRTAPRLYLLYCEGFGVETDEFWLDWLRTEDGWLKESKVIRISSLEDAIQAFRNELQGLVVYDPSVPATASLASTAAGCDSLLPVRFSRDPASPFGLCRDKLNLPVKLWLVNSDGSSKFTGQGTIPDSKEPSTGSAKNDTYRWAIPYFIESGRCDPRFVGYYIDSFWLQLPRQSSTDMHTLSNHDYFIANRGFFFDLSPWADEKPNDDPTQRLGLDRETFFLVMHALQAKAPQSMIKVGGFTPWPYKYTDHPGVGGRHGGVPTEWKFAQLISEFNGYMEADAAGLSSMANASFFRHYPLQPRYRQPNARPSRPEWRAAGHLTEGGEVAPKLYVGHYAGDYDAPSWFYKAVPAWWKDPERGRVAMGWAFNPNLADRAPQALAFAYRHATPNDFFIAGDSGAGYVNPRALTVRPHSKLPPALDAWAQHCAEYFRRWDMTITGFVLDGSGGRSTDAEFAAYHAFSPDGCGTHFEAEPRMFGALPTCPERDLPESARAAAASIAKQAEAVSDQPRFLWGRSILRPPSWYARVSRILAEEYPQARVAVVDPYTFFGLIKEEKTPGTKSP
jgi:hypothetical protein